MPARKTTALFIILLVITASLVLISTFLLIRVSTRAAGVVRQKQGEPYKYHIMMIGERIDSAFWQEVYAGASEEGSRNSAIIELVGPASDADNKTPDEYINYAIDARVDGILAFINDKPATRQSLLTAASKGIPVITLENDVLNTSRESFVGVSSYELGKLLGGLIHEAAGEVGNALVLINDVTMKSSGNIMLSSIQEAIQSYPSLHVSPIGFNNSSRDSGYEELIRQRILNDTNLEVIVCLNVEDTMRVAQTVIDLNKSDRIAIIAFRESKDILDYVRKGIVYAVVVIDARQMGMKAAASMFEFLETKHANDYVITDMHVVKKETVEEYLK